MLKKTNHKFMFLNSTKPYACESAATIRFAIIPEAAISASSHSVSSANFFEILLFFARTSKFNTTSHHILPTVSHATKTGHSSHTGTGDLKYEFLYSQNLCICHGKISASHPR